MLVEVVDGPIDAGRVQAAVARPENGAVLIFHGIVRNHHEGREVSHIDYQAYRGMAERELGRVAEEVAARHGVEDVALVHRVGEVRVGEASLVVAVGAAHRAPAFAAALEMVDVLKARVPIWKKEHGPGGTRWAEGVRPELPGGPAAG